MFGGGVLETAPLLATARTDEQASPCGADSLRQSCVPAFDERKERHACPRASDVHLEAVLRWQLPALLRVAQPYHVLTLAALSIVEAYIVSRSGAVAGSFYRVLVDHEAAALWRTVRLAAALYALTSCVQGVTRWLSELVAASSRAAVTAWLHQLYCRGSAFARLPSAVDNPDQRMAADVGRWAEELGHLAATFAAAPLKVLFYTHWMARLTSAPAVALVYLFFAISALLQRTLLGTIAAAVFQQGRLEGHLRSAHARLRVAATEAALSGASPAEHAALQARLTAAVANQRRLAAWHAVQAVLTRWLDYAGAIISYCCVALAIFHASEPAAGDSGGKAAERVSNACFAALMLMNSFSQMMDASDRLSLLAGLTARIHQLAQALTNLQPELPDSCHPAPRKKAYKPPDPAMAMMLEPPHTVAGPRGPLELSIHSLGRDVRAELAAVLPDAPHSRDILAVLTFQFASEGVQRAVGQPPMPAQAMWQQEMDRMLDSFVHWATAVRMALEAQHLWCDVINPLTARPLVGASGQRRWSEVTAAAQFLGYARTEVGACPAVQHPVHGTASYPATLFTDAPLHVLRKAIAEVGAGGTSLPEQPTPRPLLSLRDLSYSTPDGWPCASRLSFDLPAGAAVLVEGPSGCGKSTLVRVLAGLHPAHSGTVQLPPRDEVMFLPQQALLAPGVTLWDQLTYGCGQPAGAQQMAAALQRVGLQHLLQRVGGDLHQPADWAGQLSVGEVQRLAVARLLLQQPPLAILDEATSAVGAEMATALYGAIRAAGISVLTLAQHGSALQRCHDTRVTLAADGSGAWTTEALPDSGQHRHLQTSLC